MALASVPEEKPTLIGELREIRELWGEGFDEDVAQPLAQILLKLRAALTAQQEQHERELDDRDDQIHELEQTGEDNAAAAGGYRELLDDLADVPRGVRTLEEVMDKHPLEIE